MGGVEVGFRIFVRKFLLIKNTERMMKFKFLRKLLLISLVAMTFGIGFSACGDDDDNDKEEAVNSTLIVGSWKLTGYEGWSKTNGELDWESNSVSDSEIFSMKFNSDKSGEMELYQGLIKDYEYVLNGSELVIYDSYDGHDSYDTYKVSLLTETTLVLEYYSAPTEHNPYEVYEKMTFTRN